MNKRLYIPQALFIKVARFLNFSYNRMYMAGKIGNLLAYIILMFFAIRIIKSNKVVLASIALLPTLVLLASSYSYDAMTTGFLTLGIVIWYNEIIENKKIKFQYYQWNVKKEMELRHNGAWYHISPWGLSWDDENYYLVGYDSDAEKIKHYRVDKMLHIRLSSENREGKEFFNKLDMADYAKKSFGMFGGKEQTVKLLVKNSLAGVIIDRFGKNGNLFPGDEEHCTVTVDFHVSRQFLGWVFSLGDGIKIAGPDDVVEQMRIEIKRLTEQYS